MYVSGPKQECKHNMKTADQASESQILENCNKMYSNTNAYRKIKRADIPQEKEKIVRT